MPDAKIKILISGGGTGGHIFPAIAIADAIKRKEPSADILFTGALGKMEMEKVPMAGYPIRGLWISGFQRRLSLRNLLFPLKLVLSMIKASGIVRKFKPHVAVGVGGYASGPTCKAAARKGIPVLLQEQNSFPGITNKLLAKDASTICVAYDGMDNYFPSEKIIKTGNPVRKSVVETEGKRIEALQYFELNKHKPVVLIIGGSQGAKSINESIDENLQILTMNNIQLIWQTGKFYTEHSRRSVLAKLNGQKKKNICLKEFITRMDLAYAAADLVISRAGAIAISELCLAGKPCVLIPLPLAAEDHQTKNARALADKDAVVHLPDALAKQQLGKIVIDLIKDKAGRDRLAGNIKKFGMPDSADKIADEVLKLVYR